MTVQPDDAVIAAGRALANIAYNLSQNLMLSARDRTCLVRSYEAWDAAGGNTCKPALSDAAAHAAIDKLMTFSKDGHFGYFDIVDGKFDYQGDIPCSDAARLLFETLAAQVGEWWMRRAAPSDAALIAAGAAMANILFNVAQTSFGDERLRTTMKKYQEDWDKARSLATIPAAEPVAWRCKDHADGWVVYAEKSAAERHQRNDGCLIQPLYASPHPARETDDRDAEIERLRALLANVRDDAMKADNDLCSAECRAEIAEALAAKREEALTFYARRENYIARTGMDSPISRDHFGDLARSALAGDQP